MKRVAIFLTLALAVLAAGKGLAVAAQDDDKVHKVVIHLTSNNPKTMNITLNNAVNVTRHYGIGNVEIEIVANGPGLAMFMKGSKLQKRLQSLHAFGNITFGICNNTMNKLKLTKSDLLQDAFVQNSIVPAGVVRAMELQEAGYSYIRP